MPITVLREKEEYRQAAKSKRVGHGSAKSKTRKATRCSFDRYIDSKVYGIRETNSRDVFAAWQHPWQRVNAKVAALTIFINIPLRAGDTNIARENQVRRKMHFTVRT